tara:strand:+ start:42 stop:857 length:816 start_codon:yes stop_codon:yes gene_type:complete
MVRKTICAAAILVAAILSISVALAIPVPPHQFYGTVTIDGLAADDGFTIDAKIDGTAYDSSTTDGGNYGYSPELMKVKADDPMTGSVEGGVNGDTVEFYIGSVKAAETAVFADATLTELDLTFISVCGDGICMGTETSGNCAADCSGTPPAADPQCDDGIDNDGDGDIDFPDDSDCTSAADNDESTPESNPPSSSRDSKRKSASGGGNTATVTEEDVEEEEDDEDKMSIADSKDGEAITGSAIGVFTRQTAVIGIAILIIAAIGYTLFLKK